MRSSGAVGALPAAARIVDFHEEPVPAGHSPWVVEPVARVIDVVDADERWPETFDMVAAAVRGVLGARVLMIEHVGSTAVPGLAAKPVIDIDLIVADPAREADYVPVLVAAGWTHTVREPWWHEHRLLKLDEPAVNLHVFGPESPEPWKHRIFRDHLRRDGVDRERYAAVKRTAAAASTAAGEHVMDYNARKQTVIREIYERAFRAAGLVR